MTILVSSEVRERGLPKFSRRGGVTNEKYVVCLIFCAFVAVTKILWVEQHFQVFITEITTRDDFDRPSFDDNLHLDRDLELDKTLYSPEYSEWLHNKNHSLPYYYATKTQPPLYLHYYGFAGLGHQLLRMSAAYHLAALYGIPYLHPALSIRCGTKQKGDVYDHLLGEGRLLPVVSNTNHLQFHHKHGNLLLPQGWPELEQVDDHNWVKRGKAPVVIKNEAPGYVRSEKALKNLMQNNLYGKLETDFQLYKQLMTLFERRHHDRIEGIRKETMFDDHTVFGLHVRSGNGEEGDFVNKERKVPNLKKYLLGVGVLLCDYSREHADYFEKYPLMIYIGSDTGSVVTTFKSIMESLSVYNNCSIPVVSAEQVYPDAGSGVSFAQKYSRCSDSMEAWENMFLDMYFFTRCNTVLAGHYSSFTQAAPLSYVMHNAKRESKQNSHRRHPNNFCELGESGRRMDCFDTMEGFLLEEATFTFGDQNAPLQRHWSMLKFPASADLEIMRNQEDDLNELFKGSAILIKPAIQQTQGGNET